ncbi:uncharacterized protein [Parasteatoda tepidariorum]|uniref:uncharacterized protein n=1 Tax=Parasteatoda tepidariorum TaxID=114398 RepID=UPI0039BD1C7B
MNYSNNNPKVQLILDSYILSNETLQNMKELIKIAMDNGLADSEQESILKMTETYLTKRYFPLNGDFLSICAHDRYFSLTLLKFKPETSPEIFKKSYMIDPQVFEQPQAKIFKRFSKYIAEFFDEFDLHNCCIPTGFCSDIFMQQYSLDTAVIPYFSKKTDSLPNNKDIKSYFEEIVENINYENILQLSSDGGIDFATIKGSTDVKFDAQVIGIQNVLGEDFTFKSCYNILKTLNETHEQAQDVELDISLFGVKIKEKGLNYVMYSHALHKISFIAQSQEDSHVFGYLYGNYVDGYQFFGFKTIYESMQVIFCMKNVFKEVILKKKEEELKVKASQIFLTLTNLSEIAYELKVREREIPDVLRNRFKLVQDIRWWIEGCKEDVKHDLFQSDESPLNVKIQDLYSVAIELKLVEIKREEIRKKEEAKRKKRHLRKKKAPTHAPLKKDVRSQPDPSQIEASKLIKSHLEFLRSFSEEENSFLKRLMEMPTNFENDNADKVADLLRNLHVFCEDMLKAKNSEITDLNQILENLISKENYERSHVKSEGTVLSEEGRVFLKAVKMKHSERIFQESSVSPTVSENISETLQRTRVCREQIKSSLKMRQEEAEELNYFISSLHNIKSTIQLEESEALQLSRKLLVKGLKMKLSEIEQVKEEIRKINEIEKSILYAVPDALKQCINVNASIIEFCKITVENLLQIKSKLLDFTVIPSADLYRTLHEELKNVVLNGIDAIESEIRKLEDVEEIDVNNFCYALYKEGIKRALNELDELMDDLDTLEDSKEDGGDTVKALQIYCKDIYLTSLVMREKEINIFEKELKISHKVYGIEHQEIIVTLKDLFFAALEIEKRKYEKIVAYNDEVFDDGKKLPVVFSFKDLFQKVATSLHTDPIRKVIQVHSSLKEFLCEAFKIKQKEFEVPLFLLKKSLEKVISTLIQEVKEREMKQERELLIRIQALKISNSWKELFVMASNIRREELIEALHKKVEEMKDEYSTSEVINSDNSFNLDYQARQVLTSWRKIFSFVVEAKQAELNNIENLLKKNDSHGRDVKAMEDYDKKDDESSEGEPESGEETDELSQLINVSSTCKKIYNLSISKNSSELQDIEKEMKPLFSSEYDEVKTDEDENKVVKSLNEVKDILREFHGSTKEQISKMCDYIEVLTKFEENIAAQTSTVNNNIGSFLKEALEEEEKSLAKLKNFLITLTDLIKEFGSGVSHQIKPLTDLFIKEMSLEDLGSLSENVENLTERDPDETSDVTKLTMEEIKNIIAEVDAEEKEEDGNKNYDEMKEVSEFLLSCKSFVATVVKNKNEFMENILIDLEKLKMPEKKKKTKEKVQRALQSVLSCKGIFLKAITSGESEMKLASEKIMTKLSFEEQEKSTIKYEASKIAKEYRELFHVFIEMRQQHLSSMKEALCSLENNEKTLMNNLNSEPGYLENLRSEVTSVCKDLIIGSMEMKMREINNIQQQLVSLNDVEMKTKQFVDELGKENREQSFAKVKKLNDVFTTIKKLCSFTIERAKGGVKDADEELQMLKGIFESSTQDSLIISTCIQLLNINIRRKNDEIEELIEKSQNVKMFAESLKKDEVETNIVEKSAAIKEEAKEDINAKSEMKTLKKNSDINTDIEEEDIDVKVFQAYCKDLFDNTVNTLKEKIQEMKLDLEKLKIKVKKVEKEDFKVFEIFEKAITYSINMRKEEINSFKSALKTTDSIPENSETENPLENLVQQAILNRYSEKDSIDFELLKFVRYQDSRFSKTLQDLLLTLAENSKNEADEIKEKVAENKKCQILLNNICLNAKLRIEQIESALQSVTDIKMKTELEDNQLINSCKLLLHDSIVLRKNEIAITIQDLDTVMEITGSGSVLKSQIMNIISVYEVLSSKAIHARKNEIELLQCEIIKKENITLSDTVSVCEKKALKIIETRRIELTTNTSEMESISSLDSKEIDMTQVLLMTDRFKSFLNAAIETRNLEYITIEQDIRTILQGNQNSRKKHEMNFGAIENSGQSLKRSLCTEATKMFEICKIRLLSILSSFEKEIKNIQLNLTEVENLVSDTSTFKEKVVPKSVRDSSEFTPRQLELLNDLEEDINEQATIDEKNIKVCQQICSTMIERREIDMQNLRNLLEKLNAIENTFNLKASKLVLDWRKFCKIFLERQTDEENTFLSSLKKWEECNTEELNNHLQALSENWSLICDILQENFLQLCKKYEDVRKEGLEYKSQLYDVNNGCKSILQDSVSILKNDECYCTEQLLKFRNEVTSSNSENSEDEDKILACKDILLKIVELRKKMLHQIKLEIKFLNGEDFSCRKESSVIPSWYKMLHALLDVNNSLPPNLEFDRKIDNDVGVSSFPVKLEKNTIFSKYEDLLKSLDYKREKKSGNRISSWNDILIRSFLLLQIQRKPCEENQNSFAFSTTTADDVDEVSSFKKSWDELLILIAKMDRKESECSMILRKREESHFPPTTWESVFQKAIDDWKSQLKIRIKISNDEKNLLKWRSKLTPNECSDYMSGHRYELDRLYETTNLCEYYQLNYQISLIELPKIAKELSPKSSPTNSKESPASNWEDLFRALLCILSDGNLLVRSLKKADIHVRYQAAKIYSSWEECFKIAVDKRLSEVQKELKESEILKRIATDLSKRFQLTHQKRDSKDTPESYSSASWSKSLLNNYEGHIKRLTSAIETKKNEKCETSQEADVFPVETDKEMKLFLEIQPKEHNLLGKKIVVKAIELKNEEIEMMQNKLDQLEEPVISDTNSEIPNSLLIWQKIVSIALCSSENKSIFKHWRLKEFHLNWEEFLNVAMEKRISSSKHKIESSLDLNVLYRMDWPAKFPDLNPIEHAWMLLG